ncbi:MAG: TrkH family potassium uptake protein [Candidatus Zixiibacteriota bacterium]|nr:MAG: TrkH family potassium uptake protein [candidate division Zixibacteria bacterium]
MLLPLVWVWYYQEDLWPRYVLAAAVTVLSGLLLRKAGKGDNVVQVREGFAIVTLGWTAMAIFGALPFLFTGAIPSVSNAVFESMSGFTTTGASILTDIEALPKSVLFWRSFTHWVGGMGIIIFSLAILPILGIGGMQLYKAEAPGPTKDKLTPRVRQTAALLWGVYVLFSALETGLLMLAGMDLFDALCHTFGTMATGGFSTRNASIAAYDNPWIHWIIIIFMVLAGINFALHYRALTGRVLVYPRDPEFRFYLAMMVAGTVLLSASSWRHFGSLEQGLRDSIFQVVSITTTTGYITADYEQWHPLAVIVLVLLMFMGGMAGSTGGGMKMMRILILIKQAHIEVKKFIHPQALYPLRMGRRVIPPEVITNILGFFLLYVVIYVLGSMFLVALGLDLATSFSASVACLANIGPGLAEVGPVANYGALPLPAKWSLAFLMMVGRLEVFTVLVLFSRSYWRK